VHANEIFNNSGDYSGAHLFLGAFFFAFQIYGDFSGYSDMAIGTSRLFGFDLKKNFAYPYFSRNMAEFWRRWHISLSTWFRDYLYIPLGGSRVSQWKKIRNTFIIFLVSGFWHGANWTFIIWGGLNALYFLPILLNGKNRQYLDIVAADRPLPSPVEFLQMLSTFILACLAWIFFRANDLGHAVDYIQGLFGDWGSYKDGSIYQNYKVEFVLLLIMLSIEWWGRRFDHPLMRWAELKSPAVRWMLYIALIVLIGLWMRAEESPFIYFQF
jgi:alginate O-acetyltransferase complex protein AlgI